MEMEGQAVSIYVLESEEGKPPRAVIGPAGFPDGLVGVLAVWSQDMGMWTIEDVPVPEDLGDAITEHAKSLGVEW